MHRRAKAEAIDPRVIEQLIDAAIARRGAVEVRPHLRPGGLGALRQQRRLDSSPDPAPLLMPGLA